MQTSIDASQLEACLKALYRLQTVDEFIVTMMREIPKLVASDHTSFNEINLQERRMFAVMDTPEGQMIVDRHRAAYDKHFTDNPLVGHFLTPGSQAVAKISDYMNREEWHATDIYKKFYSKFGDLHQMVVSVPTNSDTFVGIALNRLDRDFTEEDRDILLFLQPYLGQAYANAVEHTRTLGMLDSHNRALTWLEKGVVEVDSARRPTYVSPLARHYLNDFFPNAHLDRNRLPQEVEDWLGGQASRETPEGPYMPVPLVCQRDIGQVTVSILPRESETPDGGLTLLVECALVGQSSRALEKLGLSSREADVLFWLAQGKSNPEIAIILGITAPTVKKHIEAIFRKLNVSNRTEAALNAHRFFTGRWPVK